MAYYNVSFRYKGENTAIEDYNVQGDEIDAYVQKAQTLADKENREIVVTITPRVHTLTLQPKTTDFSGEDH